jgi:hypothetical protein
MIAVDLALVRASEFISSRLISFATEQGYEFWALLACCSVMHHSFFVCRYEQQRSTKCNFKSIILASTGSDDLVVALQSCTTCSPMINLKIQRIVPDGDATDRHATSFRVSGKSSDCKISSGLTSLIFHANRPMMFRDLWTLFLVMATLSERPLSRKSTSAPLADNHPVRLLTICAVCEAIYSI